jgi:hypothetical protein
MTLALVLDVGRPAVVYVARVGEPLRARVHNSLSWTFRAIERPAARRGE